jgi:hypothetical protein
MSLRTCLGFPYMVGKCLWMYGRVILKTDWKVTKTFPGVMFIFFSVFDI